MKNGGAKSTFVQVNGPLPKPCYTYTCNHKQWRGQNEIFVNNEPIELQITNEK